MPILAVRSRTGHRERILLTGYRRKERTSRFRPRCAGCEVAGHNRGPEREGTPESSPFDEGKNAGLAARSTASTTVDQVAPKRRPIFASGSRAPAGGSHTPVGALLIRRDRCRHSGRLPSKQCGADRGVALRRREQPVHDRRHAGAGRPRDYRWLVPVAARRCPALDDDPSVIDAVAPRGFVARHFDRDVPAAGQFPLKRSR